MRNKLTALLAVIGTASFGTRFAQADGTPLVLVSQPADMLVNKDSDVNLKVFVTGSPAPTYQWALNGEPIPGATGTNLLLKHIQAADGGSYSVYVQNAYQTIQSDPASVVVNVPSLPFSDDISARGLIKGNNGIGRGNNQIATTDLSVPWLVLGAEHTVWVSWFGPDNGMVTFSTDGSDFDTVLGAFDPQTISGLPTVYVPIASDDESGDYHTSKIQFNVKKGKEYVIGVASADDFGGNIVLGWTFQAGKSVPTTVLPPVSQTVNRGQSATFSITANSLLPVQYQWLKNDQPIPGANLSKLNILSVTDADVGVYSCQLTTLDGVIISDDADLQINTENAKAAAKNKLKNAVVSGLSSGGTGLGSMSVHKIHAMDISASAGYSGTQIFQTSPGKDPGEPNACGVVGGSSYWLSYTAPANGILTLTTDGSNFDTVLAVYIDNGANQGYSSLISVACDNNSGADGLDSRVAFNVTAGKVYYIQIDGVNGAVGTVYLNYNLNTPPTIGSIGNFSVQEDSSGGAKSFTIADKETAAGSLQLSATSSNPTLFPAGNITFSGTDGNRTVNVQPAALKYGSGTITVTVRDAGGNTASTSFTVTVSQVNHAPNANGDSVSAKKTSTTNSFYVPSLLSNDSDVDGDTLTLSAPGSSNLGGKISRSGDYLFYSPPTGTTATSDYFTYTVNDGHGGTATARVFITLQ